MSGVTIGNGAVIGAASVVRRNIPAYTVVIGNPAHFLRMRFDWQVINTLQVIQWWDWPIEWIEEARWLLQSKGDKIDDLYHYWVHRRVRESVEEETHPKVPICTGVEEQPPKSIKMVRQEETGERICV
jgi:hypothetical protein